ncbi:MAG TPA: methionine--tRNA ligase [Kofleriaceae bacterium]|jgi:methionyl-tRNA synthetase
MSTFYITTPIYYVNDVPHIGHAYTTISADTLARFHRMRGDETRFLTGTDEHGEKVEAAAKKRNLTPQQLCDQVAPRFREAWEALGIDQFRFIRTTDEHHKKVVHALWHRIREQNPDDLYLHTYQGWYCVGCEAFYTESQLAKDGDTWICTIHKTPVTYLDKERSWFFRLSKYEQPLIDYIEANPDFIRPTAYRNEILSFLRGGLRDLSVSRTSFSWGIPVPEADPDGAKHVIYVWMDALVNYLSDLCPPDGTIGGADVEKFWPHAVHLIGKDILRFHSVYWPAFLMAAKLPLPKGIYAHGWWTVRGEKISKSIPATRIDPLVLADAIVPNRAIGIDAMRYYLLREMPLGNDGDFTFESLCARFNAELANDLGNLINRSLTLLAKATFDFGGIGADMAASSERAAREAADHFEAFAPAKALEAIWRFVGDANRYIDQTQPWAMVKRGENPAAVYSTLLASLWVVARLIAPVLPAASQNLRQWIGDTHELKWPRGLLDAPYDLQASVPSPLFPRLDAAAQAKITERVLPKELLMPPPPAAAPAIEPVLPPQPIEEFAKLDLRVGLVVAASAIPKAKKLLQLTIDLGEAQPRTIVSGIAEAYKPEALVGKRVIVVANLPPAVIRGVESQGMILAAGEGAGLAVSAVDQDVAPGTRVR